MSQTLLSNLGKRGSPLGLDHADVDFEDTETSSEYFDITEFNPVFTAGKNSVSFNGSLLLADKSNILVECLDGGGNSLFVETPPPSANYRDMGKFTLSISVFAETIDGSGKLIFVGTTSDNQYVRWMVNITINKTLQNTSRVRFYNAPKLEVRPLLYPVINSVSGSSLTTLTSIDVACSAQYVYRKGLALLTLADTFNPQMQGQSITINYGDTSLQYNEAPIGTYHLSTGQYGAVSGPNIIRTVVNSKEIILDSPYYTFTPHGQQPVNTIITGMTSGSIKFSYLYTSQTNAAASGSQASVLTPIFSGPCQGSATDHANFGIVSNQPIPVFATSSVAWYRIISYAKSGQFSSSMIGKTITITTSQISYRVRTNTLYADYKSTFSAKIMKLHIPSIVDPTTYVTIDTPCAFPISGGLHYCNIDSGTFVVTDNPPDVYQTFSGSNGSGSIVEKSYAEIVYRNIKTYSGFVARHKVYAKSNVYPGDFAIVADSPIQSYELLTDPLTTNKAYSSMGSFLTLDQVNKYWKSNSSSLYVSQTDFPILSSLYITTYPSYSYADGNSYVIAKTTAIGTTNDAAYYPYDKNNFDNLSGTGYTSNFIDLKKDTFYELSMNIALQKDVENLNAKVSFYFTSSTSEITKEKNYRSQYGLLLGEISAPYKTDYKLFSDIQTLMFTPNNDYYGTLVIVPYQCNVILSNLSLQNYGDYGYSPDTGYIRIPFPVNIANESYTIKSELYDVNSNLIYTDLQAVQSFDPNGVSVSGGGGGGSSGIPSSVETLTINQHLYLPNASTCISNNYSRILGINLLDGGVCATNIINISMVSSPSTNVYKDYIEINTANPLLNGRSLLIHYSGSLGWGRRISISSTGIKTIFH